MPDETDKRGNSNGCNRRRGRARGALGRLSLLLRCTRMKLVAWWLIAAGVILLPLLAVMLLNVISVIGFFLGIFRA